MPNKLVTTKKRVVVHVVLTKVVEPIIEVITQPIKPTEVPLRYPCIIYFNSEHCAPSCLQKTNIKIMFHIKINITAKLLNLIIYQII
jgi:hypothetical protein